MKTTDLIVIRNETNGKTARVALPLLDNGLVDAVTAARVQESLDHDMVPVYLQALLDQQVKATREREGW
jgi:hypothetical protein